MPISAGRYDKPDALADLWVASWQDALHGIDFGARRAWIHERLRMWPEAGLLVATTGDVASGFLLLDIVHGLIDQLAVAPAAKGKGAAVSLLAAAEVLAPDGLVLDVNADNPRAVRFYTREGFKIESAGINPSSGLPTWRMRRPISATDPQG